MLDLDGFKAINDTYGHAAGDQTLVEVSKRMSAVMRADTLLARVGGDEFGVVMPNINSLDDPAGLARRIVTAMTEPFMIGSTATTLGIGIGIAVAPDDGTDHDELVRRADLALYRAKAEGTRHAVFRTRHGRPCRTTDADRAGTAQRYREPEPSFPTISR